MKRAWLFLALLISSAVAFAIIVVWYLADYQSGSGTLGGMMGQMMGGQSVAGMTYGMPSYVWYLATVIVALAVMGVVGLLYYSAYPEIMKRGPETVARTSPSRPETIQSWEFLLRTSKPDERKVLEVLAAHDGRYLQKFIVKESGLSKLKIHRIISRFAERGIVTAISSGNTNEVSLSPSLKPDKTP